MSVKIETKKSQYTRCLVCAEKTSFTIEAGLLFLIGICPKCAFELALSIKENASKFVAEYIENSTNKQEKIHEEILEFEKKWKEVIKYETSN